MPDYEFRYSGDDPIKRARQAFKNLRINTGLIGLGFILILGVAAAFTSYYTVEPEEQAVVLRFGQYITTTDSGLHFKLPFGIDKAIKVPTRKILQEEFGFRSAGQRGGRTQYNSIPEESSMLTGDLNVADVDWVVQYQISEPRKFLFNAKNPLPDSREPNRNIRDISQAVMRRVIGDRLLSDVITTGRELMQDEAKRFTQEILDKYDMGIRIVAVKLQDSTAPESVMDAFFDVNRAKQEQEEVINKAEKEYNEKIPKARGAAEKEIAEARGKAAAILNRANGDADRFNLMLAEYKKAPEITKRRLYIETMERLFEKFSQITIVDDQLKGLLPVFGGAMPTPASGRRGN